MNRPVYDGHGLLLSSLCSLVYFSSYLTRLNYGAAMSELAAQLQLSNEAVSLAVTLHFLTYGLGQILCGYIGDSVRPRALIAAGLAATSLCNLFMPLMPGIYWMVGLWGLNGLFQAMLWPPMVRILAENLSQENYRRACVAVSAAASLGTVAVYLLVPACIWISGWRLAFIVPSVFGMVVTAVWLAGTRAYTGEKGVKKTDKAPLPQGNAPSLWTLIRQSALLPLLAAVVLHGVLRDGITTWMPTFIHERYHFATSSSILTTAVLPLFGILSVITANAVQKRLKSVVAAAALLFSTGFAATLILRIFFSSNPAVPVLSMALATGCMHGVNIMLISCLPRYFAPYGHISLVSGLLNAFTYVGSALSMYGIAAVSARFGWLVTVTIWCLIAFAGTLLCVLSVRRWNRFAASTEQT